MCATIKGTHTNGRVHIHTNMHTHTTTRNGDAKKQTDNQQKKKKLESTPTINNVAEPSCNYQHVNKSDKNNSLQPLALVYFPRGFPEAASPIIG